MTASMQTHTQTFEDCSALEMLQSLRSRTRSSPPSSATGNTVSANPSPAEGVPGGGAASTDLEPTPVRVRGGGGGAWRAFIAEEARRTRGRLDMSAVSARYRAAMADPIERDRLLKLGRVGTQQHRQGNSQAYGPVKRTLERAAVRNQRVVRARLALEQQGSELAQGSDDVGVLAEYTASADGLPSAARSWTDVVALKRELFDESAAKAEALKQEARALDEYHTSSQEGRAAKDAAKALCGEIGADFQSVPLRRQEAACLEYDWEPLGILETARKLFSLATSHGAGQALQSKLLACWEKLHTSVPCLANSTLDDLPKPSHSLCFKHKVCMCRAGPTPHASTMLSRMNTAVKRLRDTTPGGKASLLGGEVVAILVGRHLPPAAVGDEPAEIIAEVDFVHWFVIGWQWQSPWNSLLLTMSGPNCVGTPLADVAVEPCRLESTAQGTRAARALSKCNPDLQWDVRFCFRLESARILGSFTPNVIHAQTRPGQVGWVNLWSPRARRPQRQLRNGGGWSFDFPLGE